MLKVADKLLDTVVDELSPLLATLSAKKTWDSEARALFEDLEKLLAKRKYKQFTGDCRDYHLTRKGQACLYDIPANQLGGLRTFRNKRVRLVCLGGWDAYSGRAYAVGQVPVISWYPWQA